MKKQSIKNERRALHVRRETVAQLGTRELKHVIGGEGGFSGWPPRCQSDVPPMPDEQ